jgi:hypothetical protein
MAGPGARRSPVPPLAALALALVAVLAPALAQQPESLGLSPERFEVGTAQAGEEYVRDLHLQNQFDSSSTIEVSMSGAAGAWAVTDPAGPFTMGPRSSRVVTLTVSVPAGTGPGARQGQVTFTTEPKGSPDGSGTSNRFGVGLLMNITVGGDAVVRLAYTGARVEDAEQGQPVRAFVAVRNDGNVRATAEASGEVLPFSGNGTLANATGSLAVVPGESAEVPVTFAAGLPVGQYRAHLVAAGLDQSLPFKVTAPGIVAPDGELHAIVAPPRTQAGRPVRIDPWFEDTGAGAIGSAVFHGEVRRDGELLEVLGSESLAVQPGQSVNLTVYWTPPQAGAYTVSGHVTYDGYQTLEKESILNVTPRNVDSASWWWLLLVLVLLALAAVAWAWRKGRRDLARRRGR